MKPFVLPLVAMDSNHHTAQWLDPAGDHFVKYQCFVIDSVVGSVEKAKKRRHERCFVRAGRPVTQLALECLAALEKTFARYALWEKSTLKRI
jgi:hypothetical protein